MPKQDAAQGPDLNQLIKQAVIGRHAGKTLAVQAKLAGLTDTELCVLWSLYHHAPALVSQRDLSHHLLISPAHISATVAELDQSELIFGQRDPSDRRRQCWQLTPAGRQRLAMATSAETELTLDPSSCEPARREAA